MGRVVTGSGAALVMGAALVLDIPAAGRLFVPRLGDQITWRLDNLDRIGGHPVEVAGSPRVVDSPLGRVVEFNGSTDGLFLDVNPLAGLERFTVEVVFQPDAGGPEEQRFVHFEERGTANRALVELRMARDGTWALDTFLHAGDAGLTLLDRARAHPADRWYTAALTYDGTTMAHFVNGVRELSGSIRFAALGEGTASIGVRQNRVSWFRGRIHGLRVSADALPAERLLRPDRMEAFR